MLGAEGKSDFSKNIKRIAHKIHGLQAIKNGMNILLEEFTIWLNYSSV